MEAITRKPLVVVDGAHNGDSIKRLVAAMREHFGVTSAVVLFGTLAGKDVEAMAEALAPMASEVFVTGWTSARAADPREVVGGFRRVGVEGAAYGSLPQAYDAATGAAGGRAIVACGSIAFAAAVREYLLGLESDMIMLASDEISASKGARDEP
jgi:dihydrofolate synthase/folylpolyglutamate synthase